MEHTTLSVQIAGRDYTLTSADSPEHTQRVASLVDRKMRELMAAGVPVLHYYTMSRTTNIQKIVKAVF